MASIANDPNGTRRILFTDPHGKRRTLRLGKTPRKAAEAVRVRVEALLASSITGQPVEPETSRWLAGVGDDLHDKLARVGLIEPRHTATLGPFLRAWLENRNTGAKYGTALPRTQAVDTTLQYWTDDTPVASIDVEAVEAFDRWMRHERKPMLARATAAKRCQVLQRVWEHARRCGTIDVNPWADAEVRTSTGTNTDRHCYVPVADVRRLINELPTAEWRTLAALARFAGVRVPSEPLRMTWADIDWAGRSIRIESPKTAHHAGRSERFCPLFPELEPYLQEAFDVAEEGEASVFPMLHRDITPQALRKPMRRARLEPWPKLFHALRASAQTDLASRFPLASVCRWLGNTPAVAATHYLQPRDDDFTRAGGVQAFTADTPEHPASVPASAVNGDAAADETPEEHRPEPASRVAQNAAQYPPAPGRTDPPDRPSLRNKPHRPAPNSTLVARAGLEPALDGF